MAELQAIFLSNILKTSINNPLLCRCISIFSGHLYQPFLVADEVNEDEGVCGILGIAGGLLFDFGGTFGGT